MTTAIDRYTGNPIFYDLRDSGPWIYSAGADKDDDHGRDEVKYNMQHEDSDIVFYPAQFLPVDQ